jgi:hypothetical protein
MEAALSPSERASELLRKSNAATEMCRALPVPQTMQKGPTGQSTGSRRRGTAQALPRSPSEVTLFFRSSFWTLLCTVLKLRHDALFVIERKTVRPARVGDPFEQRVAERKVVKRGSPRST